MYECWLLALAAWKAVTLSQVSTLSAWNYHSSSLWELCLQNILLQRHRAVLQKMNNFQIANPTSVTVHLPPAKEIKSWIEEMQFSSGVRWVVQAVNSPTSTLEVRWAYTAKWVIFTVLRVGFSSSWAHLGAQVRSPRRNRPELTWEEKRFLVIWCWTAALLTCLFCPFIPDMPLRVLRVHIESHQILILHEFTVIAEVPGQPQGDARPTAGAIAYLQGTRQVRI